MKKVIPNSWIFIIRFILENCSKPIRIDLIRIINATIKLKLFMFIILSKNRFIYSFKVLPQLEQNFDPTGHSFPQSQIIGNTNSQNLQILSSAAKSFLQFGQGL